MSSCRTPSAIRPSIPEPTALPPPRRRAAFHEGASGKAAGTGREPCLCDRFMWLGTFRPVKAENHRPSYAQRFMMSAETAESSQPDAQRRTPYRLRRHNLVPDGRVSGRTGRHVPLKSAWTDIFIYPGYKFRALDALITELPSAGKYACNARFGACRAGEYPACLSGGGAGKISLFLVRRCDVHPLKSLLRTDCTQRRLHV